jgi:hypothetical protein
VAAIFLSFTQQFWASECADERCHAFRIVEGKRRSIDRHSLCGRMPARVPAARGDMRPVPPGCEACDAVLAAIDEHVMTTYGGGVAADGPQGPAVSAREGVRLTRFRQTSILDLIEAEKEPLRSSLLAALIDRPPDDDGSLP